MRRVLVLAVDLTCVVLATILALALRDNLELAGVRLHVILPYLALSLLVAAFVFPAMGTGRALWRYTSLGDLIRVVSAVVVTVLVAVALGFAFNRLEGVARALPILQALLAIALMSTVRVTARLLHTRGTERAPARQALSQGPQETVLVLGIGPVAELFLRSVTEFARERVRIAGIVGRDGRHSGRLFHNHAILGTPEDLVRVLKELEVHGVYVDRIVVTATSEQLTIEARKVLADIAAGGHVAVDYFAERIFADRRGLSGPRPGGPGTPPWPAGGGRGFDPDASLCTLVGSSALRRPYWRWKRVLDVAAALILIAVLAPLLVLVALIVAADSGPRVIFWQVRPGMLGRPFRLFKFCTMREAYDGLGRRVPDDERVSPVGAILRNSRIDELPQLFNILRGEMSFVGPRPLLPADQGSQLGARLAVRPGLTGWAQVNGGRSVSAADKTAMDLWYIQNASFALDARIGFATLRTVMLGERPSARRPFHLAQPDGRGRVSSRIDA